MREQVLRNEGGAGRETLLWLLICLVVAPVSSSAQNSAFTYQGQLLDAGQAANGSYDFQFRLADAAANGNYLGATLTNAPVPVANGLFTVAMDFGSGVFNGPPRWLEIGVRSNGNGSAYTVLNPRQLLAGTPYATFAGAAAVAGAATNLVNGGALLTNIPAANLVGTIPLARLPPIPATNLTGTLGLSQLPPGLGTNLAANATLATATIGSATINTLASGNFIGNGMELTNLPVAPGALARFAPTPPMVYDTYYDLGNYSPALLTDAFVRALAQRWATNGLKAAGWNQIWIDDGWQAPSRDSEGNLQADSSRFPSGMADLVNYLHGLGFKVGIYSSFGPVTCLGFPGSDAAHMQQDVNLFASWGMDALDIDACTEPPAGPGGAELYGEQVLRSAGNAILNSHRDMSLFVVILAWPQPWEVQYEANGYIGCVNQGYHDDVGVIVSAATLIAQPPYNAMIGPGHYFFNGAMVNYLLSPGTQRAAVSLCAMTSSMLVSGDWHDSQLPALTNQEVMAIHQDPAAICGSIVWSNNLAEVWVKPLGGGGTGAKAIALANWSGTNQDLVVNWNLLGAGPDEPITLRDLWAQSTLGTYSGSWTNTVPASSVQLFKATPAAGLSTNLTVLGPGLTTHTLVFRKGVLVGIQ